MLVYYANPIQDFMTKMSFLISEISWKSRLKRNLGKLQGLGKKKFHFLIHNLQTFVEALHQMVWQTLLKCQGTWLFPLCENIIEKVRADVQEWGDKVSQAMMRITWKPQWSHRWPQGRKWSQGGENALGEKWKWKWSCSVVSDSLRPHGL